MGLRMGKKMRHTETVMQFFLCKIQQIKSCKTCFTTCRVSSGQGKIMEIPDLVKVREKSGNFVEGQGKNEYWEKSEKSKGICI